MQIPDNLIPGLTTLTGPVLIYFVKGRPEKGFALRKDECVMSLRGLEETRKKAGLKVSEDD